MLLLNSAQYWFSDEGVVVVPMSTAIVRIYTKDGFILAADGRGSKAIEKTANRDNEQKVFPMVGKGRALAYAMQGMMSITDLEIKSVVVDLAEIVQDSIEACSKTKSHHNLDWYAHKFAHLVQQKLTAQINGLPDYSFPVVVANDPEIFLQLFLCGYYRGVPSDSIISFRHENHKVTHPDFHNFIPISPLGIFGSGIVSDLLFKTKDARFAEFRTDAVRKVAEIMMKIAPDKWDSLTLEDGVDIATNYIRACDSEEGREVDNQSCSGIGGHIHVAEITEGHGFRWVIPPKATLAIPV